MRDDLVKLTFVGDLMYQEPHKRMLRSKRQSCDVVFDGVRDLLKESDYVLGNLETPVSASNPLSHELMAFNAPLDYVRAVKDAGIDFVSIANNHIWDCGAQGVDETIAALQSVGLDCAGAYARKEDVGQIFVKDVGGVRIAVVACTYETNFGRPEKRMTPDTEWKVDLLKKPLPYPLSFWFSIRRAISNMIPLRMKLRFGRMLRGLRKPRVSTFCTDSVSSSAIGMAENESYRSRIEEKIRRAKELADFVVVMPHVGGQHNPAPGRFHEYTMKWMSDAGADLIVAGHAHLPQKAYQMANGAFAAYCLGDFTFAMVSHRFDTGFETNFSIILNVYVSRADKKIRHVEFTPCMVPVGEVSPFVVADLYRKETSSYRRERIEIDNETVVRAVRGGVLPVSVQTEYEIPLTVPLI